MARTQVSQHDNFQTQFCILTRSLDVIVLTAMGEEAAIDAKEAPK